MDVDEYSVWRVFSEYNVVEKRFHYEMALYSELTFLAVSAPNSEEGVKLLNKRIRKLLDADS